MTIERIETVVSGDDESYANFINVAAAHAAQAGSTLPEEPAPAAHFSDPDPSPGPGSGAAPIEALDIGAAGVNTVIWATGYRYNFDCIELTVFAREGDPPVRMPLHRRGVTAVPGACFLGLALLHKAKSSFLSGVGEDAADLAEHIATRVPGLA